MAHSLEVLLYNRRLRKNISTRLNQAERTDLPTSFTPQLNTPHNVTSNTPKRLRSRRKHTKTRPANKTNARLDTSSVVNLSNVTLTDNQTQLLARGLGFCPSPRHIDCTEVNADFDEFARRLRITEFFHDYTTDNQSDPFHPKTFGHHPPTETTRLMLTSTLLNMTYSPVNPDASVTTCRKINAELYVYYNKDMTLLSSQPTKAQRL